VLDLDGEIFGKPADEAAARAVLRRMSGREHWLRTGVALRWEARGLEERFVESTRLRVRDLAPGEIEAYVATGEWRGCAGGYRLEGRGVLLFEAIEGDYFNILGLPLLRVLSCLRLWGLPLFS
jgi:septum formation protein